MTVVQIKHSVDIQSYDSLVILKRRKQNKEVRQMDFCHVLQK